MDGDPSLYRETGMIRVNQLSELCRVHLDQIPGMDGEVRSLLVKVAGCLWTTGASRDHIQKTLSTVICAFTNGGRRGVSSMVKGWSNAIRALLARQPYDTSSVGFTKRARNCRFAFRRLGATNSEIDVIIALYDSVSGIPPILLAEPYWRVLLPEPSLKTLQAVAPLSNLGRACPIADRCKCEEVEKAFFDTTGRVPDVEFDFHSIGRVYGYACGQMARTSHIPLNTHASYSYSRELGGKMAEFLTEVVDNYLLLTLDQLFPTRPSSDLVDMFGNLALYREDWQPGLPITSVMYPLLGGTDGVDQRLGLFGIHWAIRSLALQFPGSVTSDSQYLSYGSFIPVLHFSGTLPSRVTTLAEEGYKARVITIVTLSASIVQGVARYFLDKPMRRDIQVKLGLLSKVKLYDFMVHLNGSRRGIDSVHHPSLFYRTAVSADLTTATDTPPRSGPMSLLSGFIQSVSFDTAFGYLNFAVEVGCSPRGFNSRYRPSNHVHNCGIMMGEGLSGTYLNVMSGIVRAILRDFMYEFDFYSGTSTEDAKVFVKSHTELIQAFLDEVEIDSFGETSSQSGDDVIIFDASDPLELKRYLILLYVVFGEVPSESTFYSSEYYATFTEEAAYKHDATLGWIFLDSIKPRLYACQDADGISPILSRISQITGSLQYINDDDYKNRVCDVVDMMIQNNPVIYGRMERYNLVPSFPPWLGGLDHPLSLLEGTELYVPLEDRELVMKLLTCSLEELFAVKYSWATEDLPEDDVQASIRSELIRVFRYFQQLPNGDEFDEIIDLHTYSEDDLVDRDLFPNYNSYRDEVKRTKEDLGLKTLDEIAEYVANGLRFRYLCDGAEIPEVHPMVKLRNRREVLMSLTSGLVADPHEFRWQSIKSLRWRMLTSYGGKCVKFDCFLDVLDLQDLPSLSVSIPTFVG